MLTITVTIAAQPTFFVARTTVPGPKRQTHCWCGAAHDGFGRSVALSGDVVLVGTPGDNGNNSYSTFLAQIKNGLDITEQIANSIKTYKQTIKTHYYIQD